jgi:uracil-DNA glycosylase
MEKPDFFVEQELARWLRYYRDLGFTHVSRREAEMPKKITAQQAPSSDAGARPANALPASDTIALVAAPSYGLEAKIRTTVPIPSPALVAIRQNDLFRPAAPQESLEQIRENLGDCKRCKLWKGRKSIVFGSGNPTAELVFVGEGPGADEDEQGLPFVGRAGQLLTDMIEKGLKIPRPEVYICNIVKCRPPGNRKPEREEVAACREFVERQIDAVRPRVICAMGSTAAETLLGSRDSMGSLRGRWHEFRGFPVMVTYHPAFLLRDPSRKADTWADLKMILAYMNATRSTPGSA